jgi:hypothetical protein
MEVLAVINAVLSVVGGYALGYVFFIKVIKQRWGSARLISRHAKIKYWSGAFSAIAIGQGFATIFGEMIYNLLHVSHMRMGTILLGTTEIVLYPLIFFAIGYALTLIFSDSLKDESINHQPIEGETKLSIFKSFGAQNPSEQRKTIFLFGAVVLVCIFAFQFSIGSSGALFSSGEFKLSNCEKCEFGKCEKLPSFTGFKVLDSSVQIYLTNTSGTAKIHTIPNSSDMKCSFAKSKNFMFDCESNEFGDNAYSSVNITFNGSDKFIWTNFYSIFGKPISNGKMICDVR